MVSWEKGAGGGEEREVGSWGKGSKGRPDAVVCEVSACRDGVVEHILRRALVRVRPNDKSGHEVHKSPCAVLVNLLHKRMPCVTNLDGGELLREGRGVSRAGGEGDVEEASPARTVNGI